MLKHILHLQSNQLAGNEVSVPGATEKVCFLVYNERMRRFLSPEWIKYRSRSSWSGQWQWRSCASGDSSFWTISRCISLLANRKYPICLLNTLIIWLCEENCQATADWNILNLRQSLKFEIVSVLRRCSPLVFSKSIIF